MAGKKGRSGGHNKVRMIWGDEVFESRKALAEYHGVTSNAFYYYIKTGAPFRGAPIDYAF